MQLNWILERFCSVIEQKVEISLSSHASLSRSAISVIRGQVLFRIFVNHTKPNENHANQGIPIEDCLGAA